MKAVLLQTDIIWGEPDANIKAAQAMIDRHPGADLYVLPEMFTTGFATQEGSRLDETPELTVAWMQSVAKAGDCAVAGSVALCRDGRCYNRFFFVTPDSVTEYDKRHLFSYGGENDRFTAGGERMVVEYKGLRFLLLVCYDLRFPVWARNRDDYDAMVLVANWPDVRQDAWDTLTKARAIENQCYVIAVNRSGSDPVCNYQGGSTLYDPFGKIIVRCKDYTAEAAEGEIDMSLLEDFRAKFPVLRDADEFKLI